MATIIVSAFALVAGALLLFLISLMTKRQKQEHHGRRQERRQRGMNKKNYAHMGWGVLVVGLVLIVGFSIAHREWGVLIILGMFLGLMFRRVRDVMRWVVRNVLRALWVALRILWKILFGWERTVFQDMSPGQRFVLVLILLAIIALVAMNAIIGGWFKP